MKLIDVTDQVDFRNPDDELLPVTKCVCGAEFNTWMFNISIYDDQPTKCPQCGRKFVFHQIIRVYEVQE